MDTNKLVNLKNKLKEEVIDEKNEFKQDFLEKINKIKGLIKSESTNQEKSKLNKIADQIDSIDELISDMPNELIENINSEIEFCLELNCSPELIKKRVSKIIDLLNLAYKDNREYLNMYGRNYHELLMKDYILELCEICTGAKDLNRIVRMNFDLLGLGIVNSFGKDGRKSGNIYLELFANLLENGETARSLKDLGITVRASAEGGSCFGWILYSPFDLRNSIEMIKDMLAAEFYELDFSHIIDFSSPEIDKYLKNIEVENSLKKFKPEIAIGSVNIGEVIENIDVENHCDEIVKKLVNESFRISHQRCLENKLEILMPMKDSDFAFFSLYGKENSEVLEEVLYKKLNDSNSKILI